MGCLFHHGGFTSAILKCLPPPPPPAPPLPSAEDTILHFTKGLRAEHKIGGARLYCEVENLPEDIIISWTKNGKELEETGRHRFVSDFDTGVVAFEINAITTTDAGRYQVSFVTPLGMFDTRVNYEFSGDLFKAIMRKAMDCEEDERILAEEKEAKKSAPAEQDLVVEEESFVEDNKELEEVAERLEQLEQENEISQEADDWVKITSTEMQYEKAGDDEMVLYLEVEDYDSEISKVQWFKDNKLLPDAPGTRYKNSNEAAVGAQAANRNICVSLYIANLHEADGVYACAVQDEGDDGSQSESIMLNLTKYMIQEKMDMKGFW